MSHLSIPPLKPMPYVRPPSWCSHIRATQLFNAVPPFLLLSHFLTDAGSSGKAEPSKILQFTKRVKLQSQFLCFLQQKLQLLLVYGPFSVSYCMRIHTGYHTLVLLQLV